VLAKLGQRLEIPFVAVIEGAGVVGETMIYPGHHCIDARDWQLRHDRTERVAQTGGGGHQKLIRPTLESVVGAQRRVERLVGPGTVQLLHRALKHHAVHAHPAHQVKAVHIIGGRTVAVIALMPPFGGVSHPEIIAELVRSQRFVAAMQAQTLGLAGFLEICGFGVVQQISVGDGMAEIA